MSFYAYTIINPMKFMTRKNIAEKLAIIGFPESVLQINVIKKDEMAEEIELIFKIKEIGEKFYYKLNNKPIDNNYDYCLKIKIGSSNKKTKNPIKIKFKQDYLLSLSASYYIVKNAQGLTLLNNNYIAIQNQFLGWLVQKIQTPYIKGQNLFNYNIPIFLCDDRTFLQVFPFELLETPKLLNKIAYIIDPIEKLKYITAMFISQMHLSVFPIKPINPLLGETYQVKIGNLFCYFEQTGINPPTTNIYCFDSEKLYKIYGYIELHANTNINSCKIHRRGKIYIQFNNGVRYRLFFPCYFFGGLTVGPKIFRVKYSSLIIDEANRIVSIINFSDNNNKEIKIIPDKFKGYFLSLKEIIIDKYKCKHEILEKQFIPLASFDGEWTKFIKFDNKIFWKRNVDNLYNICESGQYKLKSDSSLREDIKQLNIDDIVKAQQINNLYNEKERNDMILRNKNRNNINNKNNRNLNYFK